MDENDQQLLDASKSGSLDKVQELLQDSPPRANVNAIDTKKRSSLHWASKKGYTAIVNYLIEKGADVQATDQWDITPLHRACFHGYLDIAKQLVANGANVHAKTRFDKTPLHFCCEGGHISTAKWLLDENPAPPPPPPAPSRRDDKPQRSTFSLTQPADPEIFGVIVATDQWGFAPLHWAARQGHTAVVQLLLEKERGADVHAVDHWGCTALHRACQKGRGEVVSLLIQAGSNVQARDYKGHTPFQLDDDGDDDNDVNRALGSYATSRLPPETKPDSLEDAYQQIARTHNPNIHLPDAVEQTQKTETKKMPHEKKTSNARRTIPPPAEKQVKSRYVPPPPIPVRMSRNKEESNEEVELSSLQKRSESDAKMKPPVQPLADIQPSQAVKDENVTRVDLPNDVYSLFFVAPIYGTSFWFAIILILGKLVLYTLILTEMGSMEDASKTPRVLATQFLLLPVVIALQENVTESCYLLANVGAEDDSNWDGATTSSTKDRKMAWEASNVVRLIDGIYSLILHFLILLKAPDMVGLLLNFAGLQFLASVDDLAVQLAAEGYLYGVLERDCLAVENAKLPVVSQKWSSSLDTMLFVAVLVILIILWGLIQFSDVLSL